MKEYIERDYLVKEAEAILMFRKQSRVSKERIEDAMATLEWLKRYAPAADVVEVVHGRWEYVKRRYEAWTHRCSECGEIMTTQIGIQANYCHNCGVKMDKGE